MLGTSGHTAGRCLRQVLPRVAPAAHCLAEGEAAGDPTVDAGGQSAGR